MSVRALQSTLFFSSTLRRRILDLRVDWPGSLQVATSLGYTVVCTVIDWNGELLLQHPPHSDQLQQSASGAGVARVPIALTVEAASRAAECRISYSITSGENGEPAIYSGQFCLPLVVGDEESMAELQKTEAAHYWGHRVGNGLKWPFSSMFFSEKHSLLYVPIAKCACTSMKQLFSEIASMPHAELAAVLGIHLITDRYRTGVQLKDVDLSHARRILASQEYFKFAIVRDPFQRLVSAYLEKFVFNRHSPGNLWHTQPVYRYIQGESGTDLAEGISFSQFLDFIFNSRPQDLDPHWRPQSHYIKNIVPLENCFPVSRSDALAELLSDRIGREIRMDRRNTSARGGEIVANAWSMTAAELDNCSELSSASFDSFPRRAAIRNYYSDDFDLLAQI